MARVKLGPLVTAVNGSIGGITFRSSGASATVQLKPTPKRTRTLAQNEQQQLIQQASQAWNELTTDEQHAWETAAAQNVTFNAPSGKPIRNGRRQFISYWASVTSVGHVPFFTWPKHPVYYFPYPWLPAFAVTPDPLVAVLLPQPVHTAPIKVWIAPAPRYPATTSRPIWRVLWSTIVDGEAPWVNESPFPEFTGYADLTDAALDRAPDFFTGQTYQMRIVQAFSFGIMGATGTLPIIDASE
jgi:hypothetical protein